MTEQDWRELMVRYDAFGEPPVRDKPKDECQCFSCGMARGMRKAEDAHCSCTCHDGKWNWMCKLHGMND